MFDLGKKFEELKRLVDGRAGSSTSDAQAELDREFGADEIANVAPAKALGRSQSSAIIGMPAVVPGLQGDVASQQLYEARFMPESLWPKWVSAQAVEITRSYWDKMDLFKVADEHGFDRVNNRSSVPMPAHVIENFGLHRFLTYAQMADHLADTTARANQGKGDRVANVTADQKLMVAMATVALGEVGYQSRCAMRDFTGYALNAHILDDLLNYYGVSISPVICKRVCDAAPGPWRILESKVGATLIEAASYIAEHHSDLPSVEKERLVVQSIGSSSPPLKIERLIAKQTRRAKLETEHHEQEVVVRPTKIDFAVRREHFIDGICQAMRESHSTLPDMRDVARRFYSIHIRGACSYAEVIKGLRSGANPYDLIEKFFFEHLRRPETTKTSPTQAPTRISRQPSQDTSEEYDKLKIRFFEEKCQTNFEGWLENLDPASSSRIRARLVRVRNGNLGDFEPIKGISPQVFELKVVDFRIYFLLNSAEREIQIVVGGLKSDQLKDIRRVRGIVQGK